jgi:hypothetical protein
MQHLVFANESEAGDLIRVNVPCDITEIDDQTVARYAQHPDERSFRRESGRYVVRPPEEKGFNRMWRVRPENGHPYGVNVAIEKPLGELTPEDLTAIAAAR